MVAQNVNIAYVVCMVDAAFNPKIRPNWDRLYEVAAAQGGMFSTHQAERAGYSTHLLHHHVKRGRVSRVRRGIYRLVHYPYDEHEEFIVAWLWSERAGIISHQTALSLHELSDALPAEVHLTLPAAWAKMRLRVLVGVALHSADVPAADRAWHGPVPITTPRRSLEDCVKSNFSPELLRQAAQQAVRRGLVARGELAAVEQALAPFGGVF